MANNHQQRRDAKLAKRRKASKEKSKTARRSENNFNRILKDLGTDKKDLLKHRSIYSIISDSKELKRLSKEGKTAEEIMSREDLFEGIDNMTVMCIKLHSGVAVYLKLGEENRYVISDETKALIESYERDVVRFTENVNSIIVLDKAGKTPMDYPELVIDIADVMHTLMGNIRGELIMMLDQYRAIIESYVKEHIGEGVSMYDYMTMLHDERMKVAYPLYHVGKGNGLIDILSEMEAEMEADPEVDELDDLQNLAPLTIEHEQEMVLVEPNDPVSETTPVQA